MLEEKDLLTDELNDLEASIKSIIEGFYATHGSSIPKNHKLSINISGNYSPGGCGISIEAEIAKRQKSWNEMMVCELTKNDWKKIFKSAFFTHNNRMGSTQASRFYDHLKKLETGDGSVNQRSLSNDGKNMRWVVNMKETDRTQINRVFEMSGLFQYGLVNYGTRYGNSSVIMAKFW